MRIKLPWITLLGNGTGWRCAAAMLAHEFIFEPFGRLIGRPEHECPNRWTKRYAIGVPTTSSPSGLHGLVKYAAVGDLPAVEDGVWLFVFDGVYLSGTLASGSLREVRYGNGSTGEWELWKGETTIRVNSGAAESSLAITKQPVIGASGIPQPLPPMFGYRFPGTPTFFSTLPCGPSGLCTGPDGLVYGVASYTGNAHLFKIALDGTYTATTMDASDGAGICTGPDGNLWITNDPGAAVVRIAPDGSGETSFALADGADPTALCAGPDGNIWVADTQGAVWRVTPTGTTTRFAVPCPLLGVCAGPDGNIWASGVDKLFRITTDGEATHLGPTMVSNSGGIAQGADGNIWVNDLSGDKVYAVAPDGTIVHTVTLDDGSGPYQLCAGAGGDIWVTANTSGEFYKIDMNGVATSFALAEGARPYWVCSAGDGGLWISDAVFSPSPGEVGGVWLEPFIMQAGGLDLNTGPLIVKGQEISAGLPPAGTPGQTIVNTSAGVGDWEDSPVGLPSGGSVGQVVTNTAPGLGDWEDPNGLPSGGSVGQVVTNTAPGLGAWATATAPGASIVRAFPFTFDSPDLVNGLVIYTPTVGDVILEAWVQIDTLWDGTTPQGDLTIESSAQGAWSGWGGPINMGSPDFDYARFPIKFSQNSDLSTVGTVNALPNQLHTVAGSGSVIRTNTTYTESGVRLLPAVFVSTDPIRVVVSQDGLAGGADPGSTQGAAIVYLVTATPVT